MMKDPKASIMVILVISILSFSLAAVCGSFHIGEELSQQIIPVSVTSSDDMIKPIKENNFTPTKISIIQPTTTKNTTKNYTRNYTNNTTRNTSSNTSNNNYNNRNSSGTSSQNSTSN